MDRQELGSSIQSRRKLLRLTQQQVADLAGISRKTLSDLERGSGARGVTLASVLAVCEVLGLTLRTVALTPEGLRS